MKSSLHKKIQTLVYRFKELGGLMSDPEIINDQNRYRALGKEYSELQPIVECFEQWQANALALEDANQVLTEDDEELSIIHI